MKIVYADMSMELATEYLRSAHGCKNIIDLSGKFGYSILESQIKSIDFLSSDATFLTNTPEAINLIRDEICDELIFDDKSVRFGEFINNWYTLDRKGVLKLAKDRTQKELRPAHHFAKMLMCGGFDDGK